MVYVDTILPVDNLHINIYTNNRCYEAVKGVSFQLNKGCTDCLVWESVGGKSVAASAILLRLAPLSRFEEARIIYHTDQVDIHLHEQDPSGPEIRAIRGAESAMIFQDPMTALNPVYTVGVQIREAGMYHAKLAKAAMQAKAVELLRAMRIPAPEQRENEYIHQYSGGMRQRAMIAMARACNPKILIADEPTTALDGTVQAQIFDLMNDLQQKHNAAILLITHDMGVVAERAHDVVVMYMGAAGENGPVEDVLTRPAHPYTSALLRSMLVSVQA